MTFDLHLQDPTDATAGSLLDHLASAAADATEGAAAFAYASVGGVELLVNHPDLGAFLARGRFHLVVGLDGVTTPATLGKLGDAMARYPGLQCHAMVHDRPNAIFHSKLAWFGRGRKTRVLVGSGNLTRGGLLSNWEAFVDVDPSDDDGAAVRARWSAWCAAHATRLRALDDPDVLARAAINNATRKTQREALVDDAVATPGIAPADAEVLIAQISRGGPRWSQGNFNLSLYKSFFHLDPSTKRRLVLYPVDSAGVVLAPEFRQSVSVKSNNHRFELGLGHGRDYPDDGPPLAIFLRTATREFRYRLIFPGEPSYLEVDAFARARWRGPGREMIRVPVPYAELIAAVPRLRL